MGDGTTCLTRYRLQMTVPGEMITVTVNMLFLVQYVPPSPADRLVHRQKYLPFDGSLP